MAIIQISKIQQRSGNIVDLPQLDEAEFGWATDVKRLYIGKTTPNENIEVLTAYSNISFSQINGSFGNLDIDGGNIANGQVLSYNGTEWTNKGGNVGGLITLGDVSNVKIDGGAIGYVLETDGSGNLSWTPKSTIIAFIQNATKANPGVITTTEDNFFVNGSEITITNVTGMTQLNGNTYFANVITSNSFSLYSDSALTTSVNTSGFGTFPNTTATATNSTNNRITVTSSAAFTINDPVIFKGTTFGGLVAGQTYYVLTKPTGTTMTVSETVGGTVFPLITDTGSCTVYVPGGRIVSLVSGGGTGGTGVAGGANTMIQFNNTNLLDGSSDLTFNFGVTPKVLTLNGNANVGNLNSTTSVVASTLVSNVATGTQPITVTSTTRVANLNVDYANVSDFNVVTLQTTGTFFPTFVSSSATGNRALSANANLSFNAATGNLITNILTANGNINGSNLVSISTTGANFNIVGSTQTTANTAGGIINITAGTGNGLAAGGNLNLTGGDADSTATGLSSKGGNVNITAGIGYGIGEGGRISLRAGNSGNANSGGPASITLNSGTVFGTGAGRGGSFLIQGGASVGTDVDGVSVQLFGGYGTGNGTPGRILFSTTTAGPSGNSLQGPSIRAQIDTDGINVISTTTSTSTTTGALRVAGGVGISGNLWVGDTINGNVSGNITGNLTGTSVQSNIFTLTGTASGNSNVSAVVTGLGLKAIASTYTENVVAASATIANAAIHAIGTPTLASANASVTATNAATFFIQNAPTAGSNMTLTNRYALFVSAGDSFFGGNVRTTNLTTGANTTAGSITGNWTLTAGSRLQATYADLAEYYNADQHYEPGTVLEFGGVNELTIASINTTRIAGVVSTDPAYAMNAKCPGEFITPLALQGRVPTKVTGNIKKGDMMVSAGNGYATACSSPSLGSIIGKSLENFDGEGVIEIVVGRL
jgi:hypothetical protein